MTVTNVPVAGVLGPVLAADFPRPPATERSFVCDACGETHPGIPGGSGLLVWVRGGEIRYEEPPLCEACALLLSTAATLAWAGDGDDEE